MCEESIPVRQPIAAIVLAGALQDDRQDAIATKGVIAAVLADNFRA